MFRCRDEIVAAVSPSIRPPMNGATASLNLRWMFEFPQANCCFIQLSMANRTRVVLLNLQCQLVQKRILPDITVMDATVEDELVGVEHLATDALP